jgi:hypothetical protein
MGRKIKSQKIKKFGRQKAPDLVSTCLPPLTDEQIRKEFYKMELTSLPLIQIPFFGKIMGLKYSD